jgi:two-component system OmpR family response regulator
LREVGATVDHAANGREGLLLAAGNDYDVMVVDRMLPSLEGSRSCAPCARPTTDAGADPERAGRGGRPRRGLRAGGDDYLVKPFAFSELHARIEALLRRAAPGDQPQTHFTVADLELDLLTREVTVRRQEGRRCSRASSGCWNT